MKKASSRLSPACCLFRCLQRGAGGWKRTRQRSKHNGDVLQYPSRSWIDERLSLPRIADVIRDSGAEIVGLQEVDRFYGERSDFQDQAKDLAGLLGYHYAYGANLDLEPAEGQTNNRQYGTAIVSKYPILRSENVPLSAFGKERGVLHAVVNLKGIHVDVYNTHLGLDVTSRTAQAQEIIELASASEGPAR